MNRFCQLFCSEVECRGGTNTERHQHTFYHFMFLRWTVYSMLLAAVLALVGCFPVEAQPPPQYERIINVEPTTVHPGTLIVVHGSDWKPNEELYINMESLAFESTVSGTFAVTKARTDGTFDISFFYPQTPPWTGLEAAKMIARPLQGAASTSLILSVQPPVTPTASAGTTVMTPTPSPTIAITSTPRDANNVARITSTIVNVRQGPSTDYPVLLVVEEGDSLYVLGQSADGAWLYVRLINGRTGWVLRTLTNFQRTVSVSTPPPLVIVTPTPVIADWRGEYFGNRTLSGSPQLVRNDATVNFDWGFGSPSDRLPAENFSARWTRSLDFPAGNYRFFTRADDGVRVRVDNTLIIDQWREQSTQTYSTDLTLNAGSHYLSIEYFEGTGRAEVALWWQRIGDFDQWRGEYFGNTSLAGQPSVVRNDADINFNWQGGAPASGLPMDGFSARWTRSLHFASGLYRFQAEMDDGLRLYVDGNLVIDQWRDGSVRKAVADLVLFEGVHALRIEYYEQLGDALAHVWWEKLDSPNGFPDWKGEYWNNPDLSGSPVLVRNDRGVNFNWGVGSPAANIGADNFSGRWTRHVNLDSGVYRFHATADDGVRLWIDGQRIVDEWYDGATREIIVDRALSAGRHELRVEYYEHRGGAMINIWWERMQTPGNFPDWKGEYWSNQDLRGTPVVVRNDSTINFRWGTGAPAAGIPVDHFSARWTRQVRFEPGFYRFYLRSDDGVRLFIDDSLMLNKWSDNRGSEVYAVERQLEGQHRLTVEYFENTGAALIEFWWQRIETPTLTPTPINTTTSTPTSTATSTPTPTICPMATPQPLWVDPVSSTTDKLTQIITVYLGQGEVVTITSESGTFRATGNFDASSNPARVEITLLPNTIHHLTVSGRVKEQTSGGCTFGGYTLATQTDRNGAPLIIEQLSETPTATVIAIPATETPTPTPTPTPGLPTDTPTPLPPTDTPTPEPDADTPTPLPPTDTPTPEPNADTPTPLPPTDTPTPEPNADTPTPTATICPQATPEPLWVDSVTSPTDQLTQMVAVYLGNGESVTVTTESGVFNVSGEFDATSNPALVEITLMPNTTHNLTISGRVRETTINGCTFGGYTLSTQVDRTGLPLVIVQQSP